MNLKHFQEKPKKPIKRLRIMKKTCITKLDIEHLKSASSSETMLFLLQVEEALNGEVRNVYAWQFSQGLK